MTSIKRNYSKILFRRRKIVRRPKTNIATVTSIENCVLLHLDVLTPVLSPFDMKSFLRLDDEIQNHIQFFFNLSPALEKRKQINLKYFVNYEEDPFCLSKIVHSVLLLTGNCFLV